MPRIDQPGPDSSFERRIVTILFADLVGFTTLAERLDAEDVAAVQDAYFELVRDTIARHGGQLEKFIGDAVMAAFGLLRSRDDDAERAVRAGLALTSAIEALGGRIGLEVGELQVRVGVNTGEVVTTEQGPDRGRVTGDAVNSAARLQAAARPGTVLVGELTALTVADAFELAPVGPMTLKGKAEAVRPAVAVAPLPQRSREDAMGGLRAPLHGRHRELTLLAAAADRTRAGESDRLALVAPPGVGKTRLVEEFVAGLDGMRVLRARLRPDAASPFETVSQLLASAYGDDIAGLGARLAGAGIGDARAAAVVGDVHALVTGEGGGTGSVTSADRAATFDAWATALDVVEDGPVVWLIEDLHWAGSDTLEFLDVVEARRRPAGRLILATARMSLLEQIEPDQWTVEQLPALEPHDAGALVEALIGPALPQELVERIVERSDGNCLFIEELLRTWISVGTLVPSERTGTWRLTVPLDEAPLPHTVQAIYAGQLDDLPGSARTVARRASVAGRQFPEAALAAFGIEDVPASLRVLRRRALISGPVPTEFTGDEYAYRHFLLRDAAYASLAKAERARLHVQLAHWLEATAGAHADEIADAIATHYDAAVASMSALARDVADGLDRATATALAASWFERAGERALRQFAHTAARRAFERSVELTPSGDRLGAARRLTRLGAALSVDGDLEQAAVSYAASAAGFRAVLEDTAVTSDDRTTARRGLANAAAAESRTRYEQIRFDDTQRIAEEALQATGTDDPHAAVPLQLARLQGIEGLTNDYAALHAQAVDVLAVANASGDPELVFAARRAVLAYGSGDGSTTSGEFLELAADARVLGRWRDATSATINAARLAMERDPGRARRLLADAEALAEPRGLTESLAWINQTRAEIGLQDGDWSAARAACLRVFELAEVHQYNRAAVRTWFVGTPIFEVTADAELLGRAARWFEAHHGLFPQSPYAAVNHTGVDLRLAAFGLAEPPDLRDALLMTGCSIPETAASWLASIERIVRGCLDAGLIDVAVQAVDRFCAVDVGDVPPLVAASRTLVQGWLAQVAGRPGDAAEMFGRALNSANEAAAPWWIARALRGLDSVGQPTPAGQVAMIEQRLGIVQGS